LLALADGGELQQIAVGLEGKLGVADSANRLSSIDPLQMLALRHTAAGQGTVRPEHPPLSACRHRMATLPSMHALIEAHRAELLALARRRGVTGVRVFGSMSSGDDNDNSDADLLVTLAPGTSALALGGLLLDAQELLGRRVDVVTEASLHPALRERVMALAVPL